jgi:hypothetical protein
MIDTLAHAAEEFGKSPVEVLGALAAVAGLVSPAFKAGRRFWLNLWARALSKPLVVSETVRIVQNVNAWYWCDAETGEKKPVMQVVFDGHVTNISGRPMRVLRAETPKPLTHCDSVLVSNNHDARRPQILEADECAEIHTLFFVDTAKPARGKPWKSTVIFIDQYGNRHKVTNCVFKSMFTNTPPPPKEPEEFPYEIANPVEKEVVSVLKAELSPYAICGRMCGGLGSIQMVYHDRPFTGVGNDSWPTNSPLNHVIVADPEAASLQSANLEALVDFYRGLGSDEERNCFVTSLLDRLDASKGYLAASYFIVAALWRVGAFTEALDKVKRSLPENETRFFGLSNVLMLLNGLLKYRYIDFTNPMLDEIEKLTHGLKEHTFLIPAKIAAVRSGRIRTPRPKQA